MIDCAMSCVLALSVVNATSYTDIAEYNTAKIDPNFSVDIQRLQYTDPSDREAAAYGLAAYSRRGNGSKAKVAIPHLLKGLNDENAKVRAAVASSLGVIATEAKPSASEQTEISKLLTKSLKDQDASVSYSASLALADISSIGDGSAAKIAVPRLRELLDDPDKNVRYGASRALAQIAGSGAKEAIPGLMDAIKEKDEDIRADAAFALGRIHPEAENVILALKILLEQDKNGRVRENAAEALGEIGAQASRASSILLTASESDPELTVRNAAKKSLVKICENFQDDRKQLSDENLKQAVLICEKLRGSQAPLTPEEKEKVDNATDDLKESRKPPNHQYMIYIVGIGSVVSLYAFFYCFFPYQLSRFPLRSISIPGIDAKISLGFILYLPRVLDAWISRQIGSARERFEEKPTVRDRQVYVSIPISLDGRTLPELAQQSQEFKRIFDGSQCLLIWGESGSGKTSLACKLARQAMSEDASERLCKHKMIPILIEQDLDFEVPNGRDLLQESIKGQLQKLIRDSESIPDELLENLLRQRRVLVIVDHLSEMNEQTRQKIRPGLPSFAANALIVTSRLEEGLDNISRTIIQPLKLEGKRLIPFMQGYLAYKGKQNLFSDDEFSSAYTQLARIVGKRNITVLLAKLYVEQMIAHKEGALDDTLPKSIPGLMLSYLNELNTASLEKRINDLTVRQDAKIVAWECIKGDYRSTFSRRNDLLQALGGDTAEERFTHLKDRLRIIQSSDISDEVRFSLDPLAEYLAALYLLEACSAGKLNWQSFLNDLEGDNPEEIQSFMLALKDCCMAEELRIQVPNFVLEKLDQKLIPLTPL
jgi:HEAT repeat protein